MRDASADTLCYRAQRRRLGDDAAQDSKEAFALYSRAADMGHAVAQYRTGVMLSLGSGKEARRLLGDGRTDAPPM